MTDMWLRRGASGASAFLVGVLAATLLFAPGNGLVAEPPVINFSNTKIEDDGFEHWIVNTTDVSALRAAVGVDAVTELPDGSFAVKTMKSLDEIRGLAGVGGVAVDAPALAFGEPLMEHQWAMWNNGQGINGVPGIPDADIDGIDAWEHSRGNGVVVAVVDSGIDVNHPDLATNIHSNSNEVCGNGVDDDTNGFVDDCYGWDFANNDKTVFDAGADNRHGTHVSGIIAGSLNGVGIGGVAPGAKIMPLKVTDGRGFQISTAARAVDYAIENGADVINCSWGTPPGTSPESVAPLKAAIEKAESRGILVIAAAGNDHVNVDFSGQYPVSFPNENIITVGASDNRDNPASFSSFGVENVDLYAPGVSIASSLPNAAWGWMSGTSMAAPHVTGAVALLKSRDTSASAPVIKDTLLNATDPNSSLIPLSVSGGRLQATRATLGVNPEVSFAFHNFNGFTPNAPTRTNITVKANDPSGVPFGTPLGLRVTLAAQENGQVFALPSWQVWIDNTPITTDEDGQALALLGDAAGAAALPALFDEGITVPFDVTFAEGRYGVVAELVQLSGATPTISQPGAVLFVVGNPPDDEDTGTGPDSDNDGVSDSVDGDDDNDGASDETDSDDDNDGIPDTEDGNTGDSSGGGSSGGGSAGGGSQDSDNDDVPDAVDSDDDNDGVPDQTDSDDDNDGTPDTEEGDSGSGGTAPGDTTVPTVPAVGTAPVQNPSCNVSTVPVTTPVVEDVATFAETKNFKITSLKPTRGPVAGGNTVMIYGTALPKAGHVKFGNIPARVLVDLSPTLLIVEAPKAQAQRAGVVDISVHLKNKVDVIASIYTYGDVVADETPAPAPDNTTGCETDGSSGGSGGSDGSSGGDGSAGDGSTDNGTSPGSGGSDGSGGAVTPPGDSSSGSGGGTAPGTDGAASVPGGSSPDADSGASLPGEDGAATTTPTTVLRNGTVVFVPAKKKPHPLARFAHRDWKKMSAKSSVVAGIVL